MADRIPPDEYSSEGPPEDWDSHDIPRGGPIPSLPEESGPSLAPGELENLAERMVAKTGGPSNETLDQLIHALSGARPADDAAVRSVVESLRGDKTVASALAERFRAYDRTSYAKRMLILGVIGQLLLVDSVPLLSEVIWAPFPAPRPTGHSLSQVELEAAVRIEAVRSLAYHRYEETYDELVRIASGHFSPPVRAAAVDAYLWNKGSTKAAVIELRQRLPEEAHRFMGRRRFRRSPDPWSEHQEQLLGK